MRRGGGAQRALGTMWRHARVTPEAAKKVLLLSQRVTQLQLCLYLSVERFRGGRLKGWGPAGRRAVAEARCDNGGSRNVAAGPEGRGEREKYQCVRQRYDEVMSWTLLFQKLSVCFCLSVCLSIYTHIFEHIYM